VLRGQDKVAHATNVQYRVPKADGNTGAQQGAYPLVSLGK